MSIYTPDNWLPGILADRQIRQLVDMAQMIEPFVPHQVSERGVVSYGLSSYGYDVRINNEFKIATDVYGGIVDPTESSRDQRYVDITDDSVVVPPHGFMLASTVEYFRMPLDVLCICMAKSTWARTGLVVGVTPMEPGFEGNITLELSNTTNLPIRIKSFHGICQFLFLKGSEVCETTYADRKGKYMHQTGVTPAKVIHEVDQLPERHALSEQLYFADVLTRPFDIEAWSSQQVDDYITMFDPRIGGNESETLPEILREPRYSVLS